MYNKLTSEEKKILIEISTKLGVHPYILYILIEFESGWNPTIKNTVSSARGLIQIIDESAVSLGYKSSMDAINQNSGIPDQLRNIVLPYLSKYKPFPTVQSLFMSVFYPRYRNVDPNTIFPVFVQRSNPGIISPRVYIEKVLKKIGLTGIPSEITTPLYTISNAASQLGYLIFIPIGLLIYYYLK